MSKKIFSFLLVILFFISPSIAATSSLISTEDFLKKKPFEKPLSCLRDDPSIKGAIAVGYYSMSEKDYFKQSASYTAANRLAGYISHLLFHPDSLIADLNNLFYNPQWGTWKHITHNIGIGDLTAVKVVELLDETKQVLLDKLKHKVLSAYKIESYIPALISRALSKIYMGCWGFSKEPVSNNILTKLTKVFEDMTTSYKSYGSAQERLVAELEASQIKYPTYSEHFKYLETLVKKTYAGSLSIFKEVDTFAEKLSRLTIFGVAQGESLSGFVGKEIYTLLMAKIAPLKPQSSKEEIAKLKEKLAKLREERALKKKMTSTTNEEKMIKKDIEYFFNFLRRLDLTLSSFQTADFLRIAEDFGDVSTKLQIWERSKLDYKVNQNTLKKAVFEINKQTFQIFSSIVYNLLKRGDIDLSRDEADKLITQLNIFDFLSEEKIRQWLNLLKELYKDSLTTFEDWLLSHNIRGEGENFYQNTQLVCEN